MSEGGSNIEAQLAVAAEGNEYRIVYLPNGRLIYGSSVYEPESNPLLRNEYISFVKLPADDDYQLGANAPIVGIQIGSEPPQQYIHEEDTYISIFEVTQDQWLLMQGDPVWNEITPSEIGVSRSLKGGNLPAFNLSYDDLQQTLDNFNANGTLTDGVFFRIPDNNEWEAACRKRGMGIFSWGDSINQEVLNSRAHLLSNNTDGPQVVGTKIPNLLGIYDMHGNVAEITLQGTLRGGAWYQTGIESRASTSTWLPGFQNGVTNIRMPMAGARIAITILSIPPHMPQKSLLMLSRLFFVIFGETKL